MDKKWNGPVHAKNIGLGKSLHYLFITMFILGPGPRKRAVFQFNTYKSEVLQKIA